MNNTLVVFDVDMTLSEGFLQEALFVGMDHETKQNQYQKVYKGQQTWPNLFKKVLESHPPHIPHMEDYLRNIPMVSGIRQFLRWLKSQPNTTVIILSGGNHLLVRKYLQINQSTHYFNHIYASNLTYNPIQHKYTYNPIQESCLLATCKICKMKAFNLQLIMKDYDRVLYVGDGLNDLCGMSIIQNGAVFVRKGHELEKKHGKSNILSSISVEIQFWKNGVILKGTVKSLQESL